ncbi:MAG: DUF433 domain-containing protein [Acidimicrobiaceae bacterium]|nr:DUF433 domain-containing protein [Acidimicrobiaceae bacterium]MCY4294025.1 DUF433 domain-containing protein [Acidimicrobiaceae bacterium]
MDVQTLNRRIYSLADAAEILRMGAGTLAWWLDGGKRGRSIYPPVIRVERTGERSLTWAEFVEAGLLRQYRRDLGVQLHEIRRFVAALRDELSIEHPLAHARPWVGEGMRLLMRFQEECDLPGDLWLIAPVSGQLMQLPPAESFVKRVEWDGDLPVSWRPHDDTSSPVRCRPSQRFGRPAVYGISTSAIFEHFDGGEHEEEIADQFDLAVQDVRWAVAYETSRAAPLAA